MGGRKQVRLRDVHYVVQHSREGHAVDRRDEIIPAEEEHYGKQDD